MSAPGAIRHAPTLRVGRDEAVAAIPSGYFEWIVHRRGEPVAFLATPLAALGEGEELEVSVELEAGASAAVTTQGPSALLKTRTAVLQRWRIRLGEGAHLTLLPWLALPYPGSRSRIEVHVELAAGASLAAWEILAVGRVALGERFRLEELSSSWRILGPGGVLLLDDRMRVRGDDREDAEAALAGRTHIGTLYLAGFADDALPLGAVRELLEGRLELVGASRPARGLVVARALDRSSERLERGFGPVVAEARRCAGRRRLDATDLARRWFGSA